MKKLIPYALVALLAAGGTALADRVFGGVVTSSSARIRAGCFEVLSPTSIRFDINGTANYADGGVAEDVALRSVSCTSTGANLAAAWSGAITTCVPLWRTANGL